jgi:hypothetical protein
VTRGLFQLAARAGTIAARHRRLRGICRQGTWNRHKREISMTTLVTGATGFLGSAITRALLERDEESVCWCGARATGAISPAWM